jgi:CubicO group peptidase (beta-lactamase class C family)
VVRAALADVEYISGGETRKVGDLDKLLESTNTTAFIVIKDDAILYERYFNGYVRDSINTSFSMAKSFTSALIGIAIDEGYIDSVDAPVVTYIQELRGKGFDSLTIRHLLMMSSGFNYSETSLPGDIDFPWGDDVATYYSLDLRKTALGVKVSEPPGKHFRYNNYHPLLLGMILERTTGRSVAEYLEEKIWKPLGMEFPASWSIDSEESGFEKMESGINARAIDFAKFGRLFLNNGDWNGTRIISERWVAESTTRDYDVPTDYYRLPGWWVSSFESGLGYYKYMWWAYTRGENDYDFYAAGHLGQYVYVSPRRNLIIVRHGMNEGAVNSWPELLYKAAEKL